MTPKAIKSEVVPLTRELALKFATMRSALGERKLEPSHVRFFSIHIENGTLASPRWAMAFVGNDPVPYRVDGQHSSNALAECPEALFPKGQTAEITTWQVEIESELAPLFDVFDNPRASRSNADKMGLYRAAHEDLRDVDRAFLVRAAHGINCFYSTQLAAEDGSAPPLFRARDYGMYFNNEQHRQFALWLYRYHDAHPHAWMLTKPGIVAEMFSDWRSYPAVSEKFWDYVIRENHPDQDDDTRELARTFKEWSHKKPAVKQDKYRLRAKKFWERFRRGLFMAAA